MSSTNKTTNYELSQFIGSDKPAWLQDYNTDMSKIDTAIHTAASTATGADGKADANATNIGNLENLTTSVKTSLVAAINEVDGNADMAQGTANAANTKAGANETAIGKIASTLNINTYLSYAFSELSITSNNATFVSDANKNVFVARNTDGTLFKVYGNIVCTPTSTSPVTIRIPNTGIEVDTPYTIVNAGIAYQNNLADLNIVTATLTVSTGTIDITFTPRNANNNHVIRLFPCLYFNSDFGDIQPTE